MRAVEKNMIRKSVELPWDASLKDDVEPETREPASVPTVEQARQRIVAKLPLTEEHKTALATANEQEKIDAQTRELLQRPWHRKAVGLITESQLSRELEHGKQLLTEQLHLSGSMPGSYEARREQIRLALRSTAEFSMSEPEILATFEDRCYVFDYQHSQYYEVQYSLSKTGSPTIGIATKVAPTFVKEQLRSAHSRGEISLDECLNRCAEIRVREEVGDKHSRPADNRRAHAQPKLLTEKQCEPDCACEDCKLGEFRGILDEMVRVGRCSREKANDCYAIRCIL